MKRQRQIQGITNYYWKSTPEAETATGVSTRVGKRRIEIDQFLVVEYGQAFQLKSLGQSGRALVDILSILPEVLPGYHSEGKNAPSREWES